MVKERNEKFRLKGQLRLLSGRRLKSPIGHLARPTTALVREAIMNMLRAKLNNSNWLDLYSGSGIIGCEAIQNGAKTIVAIEMNRKDFEICKSNISTIAKAHTQNIFFEVINSEVNKFLRCGYQKFAANSSERLNLRNCRFDFIYIDPPYKSNSYYSVLETLLQGDWIKKECLAICEFSIELEKQIRIPSNWDVKAKRNYGKTGLLFLTPNQALHFHADIGSKH